MTHTIIDKQNVTDMHTNSNIVTCMSYLAAWEQVELAFRPSLEILLKAKCNKKKKLKGQNLMNGVGGGGVGKTSH